MDPDFVLGTATLIFATSVTPGPNNIMLMASGTNFGIRRTVPHWLGVSIGMVILICVAGFGAARILETHPMLQQAMRLVCGLYMLWLAWKIATAAASGNRHTDARPLSFLQAAAFQWINPKVWAIVLTAISLHASDGQGARVVAVACIAGLVNFPSVGLWVVAGTKLHALLQRPGYLRLFNVSMALLLIASLAPIFLAPVGAAAIN